MDGIEIKKGRLFSRGNVVIIACDHGEFDGPVRGMENIKETVSKINKNVDAVLLSPAMIRHTGEYFKDRYSPLIVGRLNWNTVYCFSWKYKEAVSTEAFSPEEALSLGIDIALVSLTLKTGSEKQDAQNTLIFRKITERCHSLGLPVIGEYFPTKSEKKKQEEMYREVKTGCRIMAELGADMIKTFYTINFEDVIKGCPVPIFILGGSKFPTQFEALQVAEKGIKDGAKGIVFGRNALQVKDPIRFQSALLEVVKNALSCEVVVKKYNLE
jgi:fructose-bisphosphate aldolase/2-amino-3,7-dideoxy-D-threo-hept-6-ulosonate synthase